MARYKTVVSPEGQTNVEITGDELAALEASEAAAEAGRVDRAMANMRNDRNAKLAETDWWSFSDSPTMTDAQTSYRQALRDLPATAPTPPVDDIEAMKSWPVWPTKP
tara:strand:+ start:2926 stop:3246 length:321 start_codon:yes stop_codon:yes gene_type:complete